VRRLLSKVVLVAANDDSGFAVIVHRCWAGESWGGRKTLPRPLPSINFAPRAGCVEVLLVSEGFDTIGAVFYHRALELKRQLGIPLGLILGAVIAHEVGHLLLDDPRHTRSGLMSA